MNEQDNTPNEHSGTDTPPEMPAVDDKDIRTDETEVDELQQARDQVQQLKDQLLRKAAEFENFRRRTREEQATLLQYAEENLIRALLPLIDDFDRSLKAGKEHPDFESFYTGTEIIRNKLVKTLEQRGLRLIEAIGKHFDVDYHEALIQLPSDSEPGTVLDVIEPGYTLHDRVIRHAKVAVASEKPAVDSERH